MNTLLPDLGGYVGEVVVIRQGSRTYRFGSCGWPADHVRVVREQALHIVAKEVAQRPGAGRHHVFVGLL